MGVGGCALQISGTQEKSNPYSVRGRKSPWCFFGFVAGWPFARKAEPGGSLDGGERLLEPGTVACNYPSPLSPLPFTLRFSPLLPPSRLDVNGSMIHQSESIVFSMPIGSVPLMPLADAGDFEHSLPGDRGGGGPFV